MTSRGTDHRFIAAAGLGLAIALVGACEPKDMPKRSVSSKVAAENPNKGRLWPVLLQACMRAPGCNPLNNFGEGAGEASGVVSQTTYFAQTADVVREGGRDYGASITLSFYAVRGSGGPGGRPATSEELPANLRLPKATRSTLAVEHRAPGGEAAPYFLSVTTAQLALPAPGVEAAKNQREMIERTQAWLEEQAWPVSGDGQAETGVKIEIVGKAGALYTAYSTGMEADIDEDREDALKRGFMPWLFFVSRNIRDEPLPALLQAIEAGDTLSLRVTLPDGRKVLSDAFYTGGYADALAAAEAALADPAIAAPLTDRCTPFLGEADAFWSGADVSPALRSCDPRPA